VSAGFLVGAVPWTESIGADPGRAALAVGVVALATVGAARVIHQVNRRARSLRHEVLAITLTALGLGAVAALALSWLMVLDADQLGTVLAVLAVAAILASALVLMASAPLGRDAERLEATVRRIEQGDRQVRADVDRADELGHTARALDALTRRLDELERERDRFEAERTLMLTSVSHDLRTPIAALQLAVEALADGLAPDPARYLASMQRDIEALTSLVEDLFLLVRLDSGRYDMPSTSVDLTEVADDAIEALAPVAADRDVVIRLDAPGGVRTEGNAAALGRVIRNLLDNAIRHAPPGSVVAVVVDAKAEGGSPRVRVIDEGPGFPASFAGDAFGPFTRADASRTRATGGAGLGLAIARGVVEAHGGRIWIEEPPGGRVAFELGRR
jgi:signal transduction histidine kinase